VVSLAKANLASYSAEWMSWNAPQWRSEIVRVALRERAATVSIFLKDRG
jgi:hypothetical protein